MAQSTWRQIHAVLELVEAHALARRDGFTVLDVGCGWGHYGVLIADQWPWARVDGIDARPDNVRWKAAYREIWQGILGGILPSDMPDLPRYDLVLLLDVIEHLPKPDGIRALQWCRRRGRTLLATPDGFMHQDGDRYDQHLSGWTAENLTDLGAHHLVRVAPHPGTTGPGQLVCLFD